MAKLEEVAKGSFDEAVLNSALPTAVFFWAPWAGPCRMIRPLLEELADEFEGRLRIVALDTNANVSTATEYKVVSIPTVLLFVGGVQVAKIFGYQPKSDIKKRLEAGLAAV